MKLVDKFRICVAYLEGDSLKAIARRFGGTNQSIRRLARSMGCPNRAWGHPMTVAPTEQQAARRKRHERYEAKKIGRLKI